MCGAGQDRYGRTSDWLELLSHFVDVGLLEKTKAGRSNVYVLLETASRELVPKVVVVPTIGNFSTFGNEKEEAD